MLTQLLWVGLGGAIGSAARYAVSFAVTAQMGRAFPYGTLTVNVTGSFAIGALYVVLSARPQAHELWRLLLVTGLLGGFTTFSAFSLETLQLLGAGTIGRALVNVVANVALCLTGCWAGMLFVRQL